MSKETSLKKASFKQLELEYNKRKKNKISELEIEKSNIEKQINELNQSVNSLIADDDKTTSKTTHKLQKSMTKTTVENVKSVREHLISIASDGKTHRIPEFQALMEKEGWKTTSSNPYSVVATALAELEKKNVFRRISKGFYELVK